MTGPFTGTAHRFYMASITLQITQDFAVDLDGDGKVDNKLEGVLNGLAMQNDGNTFANEIVAARGIDATVDILTSDPDLRNDPRVGVRWTGEAGLEGELAGGVLRDGLLTTNPVRSTQHPVGGWVALPIFSNADPTEMQLQSWQMELAHNEDGSFSAQLQGIVSEDGLAEATYVGLAQMIARDGEDDLVALYDRDGDGKVTLAEFAGSDFTRNVLSPDVHSTPPGFSLGFAMRLVPCQDDACTRTLPAPTCHDRVKNGNEVGVDCGGDCGTCVN